jgi:hypothetical protein
MVETPIAVEYLKSFYKALEESIQNNINAARDIRNFCTGFIGVVGGGSAYVLMNNLGWEDTQRVIFMIASGCAFISFFVSVLFSYKYMRIFRRKKPFPELPDPAQIMFRINEEKLREFEEKRYADYADIRRRGAAKSWIYDLAFWFMIIGFVAYGGAATLIAIFEWR